MQSVMRVLVLVAVVAVTSSTAMETTTNCTTLGTSTDCSSHLHCEWCGNQYGMCFERGVGLSCCAPINQTNIMCGSSVQVCTETETCYRQPIDTTYGVCQAPVCCGPGNPVPCAPTCLATGGICCGGGSGLSCNAGQMCCGGEEVGFACCDEDGSCCSAPDGYDHWCCAANQQCDINGGCDPAA
jgi:hypothetical protein